MGTGFVSGGSFGVTVGGTPCVPTSTSATSITCTTSGGAAGARDVVITNKDGQGATGIGAFTYNASPAPTLTKVGPVSGSQSGGTVITLVGTGFASSSSLGVTVGGVPCTSVTPISSTSATCTVPATSAGSKGVVVTNPDGQTASIAGAFTSYTFDTTTCTGARATNAPFANSGEPGVNGTASAPFLICTPAQFLAIGGSSANWGYHYKQGQNIDLTAQVITPIGLSSMSSFTGIYDGQGFAINNASFTVSSMGGSGALFAWVASGGMVSNLTLGSPSFSSSTTNTTVAPLVANLDGQVSNITVNSPTITGGGTYSSGAIGFIDNAVASTVSNVTVNTPNINSTAQDVGGAIGYASSGTLVSQVTVSNGTVKGGVASGSNYTGGAIAYSIGATLSKISVLGTAISNSSTIADIGGIIGYMSSGSLSTCSFTGSISSSVTAAYANTAGVVTYMGGNISDCTVSGSITSSTDNVAGVAASPQSGTSVSRTSFTGTITTVSGNKVLAIIVANAPTAGTLTFNQVKALGSMSAVATTTNWGGLVAAGNPNGITATQVEVSGHSVAGVSGMYCGSLIASVNTATINLTDVSINNESATGCSYSAGILSMATGATMTMNHVVVSNSTYTGITYAGAMIGMANTMSSSFTSTGSYWDSTANPTGMGTACPGGSTCPVGKTATVLRDPTDPIFSSFNQVNIWLMSSGSFPQLQ